MRKLHLQLAILAAALTCSASYVALDVAPGASEPRPLGASKALRIEAASTNATGTVALYRVPRPWPVWGDVSTVSYTTNIVYDGWTNIPYTVVSGGVTNRYNNYVATVTNAVVTATTNTAPQIVATIVSTNLIGTVTLSAGRGALDVSASNVWLRTGDVILRQGTRADGPCALILEE